MISMDHASGRKRGGRRKRTANRLSSALSTGRHLRPRSSPPGRSVRRTARTVAVALLVSAAFFAGLSLLFPSSSVSVSGWTDKVLPHTVWWSTRAEQQVDGRWVAYLTNDNKGVVIYDISTDTARLVPATKVTEFSLDGNLAAWRDEGTNKVYVQDLTGGQPMAMADPAGSSGPVVSGDLVFWVSVNSSGTSLAVVSYKVSTGTKVVLDTGVPVATGGGYDGRLDVSDADGSWVVWTQVDNLSGDAVDNVYAWNRDTGTVINVSASSDFQFKANAVIGGNWVAWNYWDSSGNDDVGIYLGSVAGAARRQLASRPSQGAVAPEEPLVAGDNVLWAELGAEGGSLYLYNISTQAKTVVAALGSSGATYDIGGDWVVWEPLGSGGGVWVYDVSDGTTTQVFDSWGAFPVTDGQSVVIYGVNEKAHLVQRSSATTTTSTTSTSSTSSSTTTTQSTTTTTLSGGRTFSDVDPNHPYSDAIKGMAAAGVIDGYPDGSFGPGNLVLRQQFAKMIVGTLGLPCSEADICPYPDVTVSGPGTLYPDNYVAVAASYGITKGVGGGLYGPYRNITRAQVITMVVRAAQQYTAGLASPDAAYAVWGIFSGINDSTHGFNIQLAEFNGLLDGIQGSGDPAVWVYQPATRGEVAQILWNLSNAGLAG